MPSFRNDYGQLAHPRILQALTQYGQETNIPYGLDYHSSNAAKAICAVFGCPNASVHFLAGGTQTNMVMISAALRPFEAVIAASSGHINVHETGAVEGAGHKIFTMPAKDGKLEAKEVAKAMALNTDEHMVKPKMVYISDSTETGTIYSKAELLELRKVCDQYGLYLFVDGARLGAALTSKENDVEPSFLGQVADCFYVGGTKNGLLYGEALVIVNPALAADFRYLIKNKGAMLAKGYGVGIMFEEAFRDGLYFELAKKTNEVADLLKRGFAKLGLSMLPSPTNQIFVSLPKDKALALIEEFGCEKWSEEGDEMTIRFVTSFCSKEKDVDDALSFIAGIL